MSMATPTPDARERLRPISVDEYHRMIDAGILDEDEKVQLIDGMLVAMTPQGRPHAFVIQELTRLLVRALGDDFKVLTQLPLTLGNDSEPEPDLTVVRAQDAASRTHHPATAALVIEVSGDSLRFDRRTKAALYARAAGAKLGQVVAIAEEGSAPPLAYPLKALRAGAAVPVTPGEQTLRVVVTVSYELGP